MSEENATSPAKYTEGTVTLVNVGSDFNCRLIATTLQ